MLLLGALVVYLFCIAADALPVVPSIPYPGEFLAVPGIFKFMLLCCSHNKSKCTREKIYCRDVCVFINPTAGKDVQSLSQSLHRFRVHYINSEFLCLIIP